MVHLKDVSMQYRSSGTLAADNLSLDIAEGEFVFLVGPSGSGKTTIIKLLTGEVQADSGELEINGYDLRTIRRRRLPALRRTLGVIFQDFRLIEDKSVYENVAFAMHIVGASKREIRERVPYVLKLVGLEGREKRLPQELSGGEQQRVAIARAIVNNPQIIIADEPTGNLDPETAKGIMDILNDINIKGTTIVMATHDAGIVNRASHRVLELSNGELIRDERQGGYRLGLI